MKMTINVDNQQLEKARNQLGKFKKKTPNIVARALNRASANIRTNINREVRQIYNIKSSDVKEAINTASKATGSSLFAQVKATGGVIGLEKFKVTPRTINPKRKSPVKVAVKKSSPKAVDGAFMAEASGPKLFRRVGKKRLPIDRLFGPSVPQMIGNEGIRERIEQLAEETFQERLQHEIKRELDRGN